MSEIIKTRELQSASKIAGGTVFSWHSWIPFPQLFYCRLFQKTIELSWQNKHRNNSSFPKQKGQQKDSKISWEFDWSSDQNLGWLFIIWDLLWTIVSIPILLQPASTGMSRRIFLLSLLVLFLGSRKKWAFLKKPLFITNYRELRSFFFDSSNINPVPGSVTPKLGCSKGMGFSPSGGTVSTEEKRGEGG